MPVMPVASAIGGWLWVWMLQQLGLELTVWWL